MPTTLTPVQQAYEDAWGRCDDLETAHATERREALAEFTAALDARLKEKYGERLRIAREEKARAYEAVMQEKEKEARDKHHPFPLGTKMVEWRYSHLSRYAPTKAPTDRELTGRRGILEVITRDSEHPDNQRWRLAKVGDIVIRLLKKDGKPSKKYEKPSGKWEQEKWVPEGTDLFKEDLSWPKPEGEEKP